jgi:hypothetical protein
MAKKAAAELPPNIKEFREITGVVLSECYKSHPKPTSVHFSKIAQILSRSPSAVMPSGRTFQDICVDSISWLTREDLIKETTIAPDGSPQCNLTARSLGGIKAIGSDLSAVSDPSSETGKREIAELMGNFFGAFTGSTVKTLAGP